MSKKKEYLGTHFGFSLYCIKEHTLLPPSFLLRKRRLSFLRILKIPQGGVTNAFQTVSVIQGVTDTCRRAADWSGVYRNQAVKGADMNKTSYFNQYNSCNTEKNF